MLYSSNILTFRTSYNEFSSKNSKDERYKNIEKSREREGLFNEYMVELRKQEKEEKTMRREQVSFLFPIIFLIILSCYTVDFVFVQFFLRLTDLVICLMLIINQLKKIIIECKYHFEFIIFIQFSVTSIQLLNRNCTNTFSYNTLLS